MTQRSDASVDDGFDAAGWVHRWDRQQAGYVPDRDATFAHILDVLERLDARPGRLLDLGCGPGSLAQRALGRWPDAEVLGLDFDPVMLELGRRTLGERVQWVEADLRSSGWCRQLDGPPLDSVVSATALHWLDPDHLIQLATGLAARLRPGGVFVDYDTLLADPANPRLAALIKELRAEQQAAGIDGKEDFTGWWTALAAEPELGALFTERDRRLGGRRTGTGNTLGQFEQALREAGFAEVDTLFQRNDRRLLVAIR